MYKLDGINISTLNLIPLEESGNSLAIDGIFNLPSRIGITEYNWGTSIEPFVQADDIILDGRDITLSLLAKKNSNLVTITDKLKACTEIECVLGKFNVFCVGAINVTEQGFIKIKAKFRQPAFALPILSMSGSGVGDILIDGYSFDDFGIVVSNRDSLFNVGDRIDVPTTEYYTETSYRNSYPLEFTCSMVGMSVTDLYNKIGQFQALLMEPGTRTIKIGGKTVSAYFKDGFQATLPHEQILKFTVKATVL